jgi:hypothetical protein
VQGAVLDVALELAMPQQRIPSCKTGLRQFSIFDLCRMMKH